MESARQVGEGDSETSARILLADDQMVACRALQSVLVEGGTRCRAV